MMAIVVIIILTTIAAFLLLMMLLVNHQDKLKQRRETFIRLREAGIKNNLSFSSQQVLNDWVMGLDGLHRKLLVVQQVKDHYGSLHIVDLNEVKQCVVKKVYRNITLGHSKWINIAESPEKIVLLFEFTNDKKSVEIPFYDQRNQLFERSFELEQKARNWETILSKMIKGDLRKTA